MDEKARRLFSALIFGILGEGLGLLLTNNDLAISTLFAVNTGVLGIVLEWIIFELPQDRYLLHKVADKQQRMIEHTAIFTEMSTFEGVLNKLRTQQWGRVTWIVADLISKKLSQHFPTDDYIDLENISPILYSDLVARWLDCCDHLVLFTIPFTPRIWFEKLLEDNQSFVDIAKGQQIPDRYIPKHVRALKNCPAKNKIRVVILTEQEWQCMWQSKNLPYLREFIRINTIGEAQLYFIRIERAERNNFRIQQNDCIIFDSHIATFWYEAERRLQFMLHRETVQSLVSSYQAVLNCTDQDFCYNTNKILKELNALQRRPG